METVAYGFELSFGLVCGGIVGLWFMAAIAKCFTQPKKKSNNAPHI